MVCPQIQLAIVDDCEIVLVVGPEAGVDAFPCMAWPVPDQRAAPVESSLIIHLLFDAVDLLPLDMVDWTVSDRLYNDLGKLKNMIAVYPRGSANVSNPKCRGNSETRPCR